MLKLAFLLIGPQAFRSQWYALAVLGGLLITLAVFLAIDASGHVSVATQEALGVIFLVNGLLSLVAFIGGAAGQARYLILSKACGLVLLGSLILDLPFKTEFALAALFSIALVLDGLGRMATAMVVRYAGWRNMVAFGIVELVLALLIITEWPLPHDRNIPLCMGLLLALSGWLLIKMALMLRTLEDEVAILALPLFADRGWYDNAPVLVDTGEEEAVENPLTVHVWTPVGSAVEPERRLFVDRYIAAVDGKGVISTGHAALEMLPDIYISHYPAREAERSQSDFLNSLRGTAENDLKGRFQPSYEYESNWWCPADQNVEFRNYNPRRLRAFWAGYRQDDTYNLTNRNCSVVVAAALDAALEGALATRFPWLRLMGLLMNPDIWVASMIRNRANSMTWTPGLVLDYASTLSNIVEAREIGWMRRFKSFLRRTRPAAAYASKAYAA